MNEFKDTLDEGAFGNIPKDSFAGHAGEMYMRARYSSPRDWDKDSLSAMVRDKISPSMAKFIEDQQFFFIATASDQGHCDASFRGREYSAYGNPLPVIQVIGDRCLQFPDFAGNGLYNSLGNIVSNPHIGLLFIDFLRQRRARVNGKASIVSANFEIRKIWPQAQSVVLVEVEQAYGNCSARIPKLISIPESDLNES